MSGRALFLLVVYNNYPQVKAFVEMVRRLPNAQDLSFAICDNSASVNSSIWVAGITHISRPDNPGYLEGALLALEAFVSDRNSVPDWIFLSNTDLTFETTNLVDTLSAHDASKAIVLAPRVTETHKRVEMNPHVQYPRGTCRLVVNALLTSTNTLASVYLGLSTFRSRHGLRSPKRPNAVEQTNCALTMYSPYGAIVGFSREFLEHSPLPRNVPLFAEEFVIAEVARRNNAPVLFESRIHVHHHAHSTTGFLGSRRRAAMLRIAFRYIVRYRCAQGMSACP